MTASPEWRRGRWLAGITLAWLVALFALRSGYWIVGLPAIALAIGSGVMRHGLSVNRISQFVLMLFALTLTWPLFLGLRALAEPHPLAPIGTVIALFSLLVVLPRRFMAAPVGAYRIDAAFNLFAILGCSHAAWEMTYVIGVVVWVVLQILVFRAADETRPGFGDLSTRHRVVIVVMGIVIFTSSLGLIVTIPVANDWALRKGYALFMGMGHQSGFSTELMLGAVSRMYSSDEIVLRVYGDNPSHLRGLVYDHYMGRGRWSLRSSGATFAAKLPTITGQGRPQGHLRSRVVTVGGDRRRYFVPLRARDLHALDPRVRADMMGIVHLPPGEDAEEVAFSLGVRDRFPIMKARAEDREVPGAVEAELSRLARRWTHGVDDVAGRLEAIQGRLREGYRYALTFSRHPGRDPVLDFLTEHREGHCEYFASAMALLARSVGIPARVVTGYLVHERNPLDGHYIVRERDAHAWVEAWIEGRWKTYDPTPPGAISDRKEMSTVSASFELGAAYLARAWRWITRRSALDVAMAVGLLLLPWIGIRFARRRRARRSGEAPDALAYGDPLPAVEALLAALIRRGVPRDPSEPLERYARRLGSVSLPGGLGEEASRLLWRYVAWRYGGQGVRPPIERDLVALVEAMSDTGSVEAP